MCNEDGGWVGTGYYQSQIYPQINLDEDQVTHIVTAYAGQRPRCSVVSVHFSFKISPTNKTATVKL
jgi:hypothetical protein